MKCDIILAGVGGQGILSIATVLGIAALDAGLNIKQAETHGMSQRGGAVSSHLRISSDDIYSDLIPLGEADLILSVEPMEALRYLPYLKEDGYIITNSTPFINIPNYPEKEAIIQEIRKHTLNVLVDADAFAKEVGNARASNMVMLGAAASLIGIPYAKIVKAVMQIFKKKGDKVVQLNVDALSRGNQFAQDVIEDIKNPVL